MLIVEHPLSWHLLFWYPYIQWATRAPRTI